MSAPAQDEHLEDISSSLHRLNEVAVAINVEVDEQNKCVDDPVFP
jgi:hypothetical protein